MATAQETPPYHMTVVIKSACVLVSHRVVTVLGQLPLPGHCADRRLNHTSSLSLKETYFLVLEHWPEEHISGLVHILRPTEIYSGNGKELMPPLCSLSSLLHATGICPEENLCMVP